MRVRVDQDKCQGHNRCFAVAPDLFEIDELGFAHEVAGGIVPPGEERNARLAVANCPEYAVFVEEE